MMEIVNLILIILGKILVVIGLICDLAASILMIRFPNFYVRLHALTVGSIGGAFVPMIGAGLIALGSPFLGGLRFFLAGGAFLAAFFTFILGGAGSHAIARATYRSRSAVMKPCFVDQLGEDKGGGEC